MDTWFDPSLSWIPGTALGVLAGLLGGLSGSLAPRGIARNLVIRLWLAMIIGMVGCLLAGVYALVDNQPWSIYYGLLLPGVIGTIILPSGFYFTRRQYTASEMRKIDSATLAG